MDTNNLHNNILNVLERTGGLIESDIINITSDKFVERFASPFFTVLFWNKYQYIKPDVFEKHSKNIFDFLLSNYIQDMGWHFFPDKRGYPIDSDDTSIIARFLLLNNQISNNEFNSIEKTLNQNRVNRDNFYVWIKTGDVRKSDIIDPIVNINVLDFLKSNDKNCCKELNILGNIDYYLSSQYYHNTSVSLWFLFNSDYVACGSEQKRRILNYLHDSNKLNIDYISLNLMIQNRSHFLPNSITIHNKSVIEWFKHSSNDTGYKCTLLEELEKIKLLENINNIEDKSTVPNILYK